MRYQIYEAKSVKYDAQQRVGIKNKSRKARTDLMSVRAFVVYRIIANCQPPVPTSVRAAVFLILPQKNKAPFQRRLVHSGRVYSISSPTSIFKYQHNLHTRPASIRWKSLRQYLLKLERGISKSLQIWFFEIPRCAKIRSIFKVSFPYSIINPSLRRWIYYI